MSANRAFPFLTIAERKALEANIADSKKTDAELAKKEAEEKASKPNVAAFYQPAPAVTAPKTEVKYINSKHP